MKTPGPHGYWAYVPEPLPPSLGLPASTVRLLSEADRALGRLAGAGRLLPNPHLLLQPYIAREALASSRIEGTQASLSDVFDAQARETAEGPVREVTNYIQAEKDGKSPMEYLVYSVLEDDAWVHKHGGDKYGIRNWQLDKSRSHMPLGASPLGGSQRNAWG